MEGGKEDDCLNFIFEVPEAVPSSRFHASDHIISEDLPVGALSMPALRRAVPLCHGGSVFVPERLFKSDRDVKKMKGVLRFRVSSLNIPGDVFPALNSILLQPPTSNLRDPSKPSPTVIIEHIHEYRWQFKKSAGEKGCPVLPRHP